MPTTKLVRPGPSGMFAAVNEVVCQLHLAEANGYDFVIDWHDSPYKDTSIEGDPWNYFFEDCFPSAAKDASAMLPYTGDLTDTRINIMRPRLYPNLTTGPMLLPVDRDLGYQLISRHIKPKPQITRIIEEYAQVHFSGHTIGLHLRGPGRLHGGTRQLKKRHALKNGVPFDLYFSDVDRILMSHSDAKVFVCSDSQMVIDECKLKYGDRLLTYKATRSEAGEMHQETQRAHRRYSGYKLGEDVIVEAYLLGRTDDFIHGNSNVSNFVLCLNPTLKAKYVYDEDPHTSLSLHVLNFIMQPPRIRKAAKVPGKIRRVMNRLLGARM